MAVNLPITVDPSNAEEGLKKIGEAAEKAANVTGESFQAAGDASMQPLVELQDKIQQLRQEVDGLGDEFNSTGQDAREAGQKASEAADTAADSTRAAANNIDNAARSTDNWSTSAIGMNQALELVKKAAAGVSMAINAMASRGNAAAVELQGSFQKFYDKLFEIAEDPRFQNVMQANAQVLTQDVVPALGVAGDALLGFWQNAIDGADNAIAGWGEFFGVLEEGSYATALINKKRRDDEKEQSKEAIEAAKKEKEAADSIAEAQKELAAIEEAKRKKQIEDEAKIFITEEDARAGIEELKKRINDVNTSTEQRKEYVEYIKAIEERILEIEQKKFEEEDKRKALYEAEHELWKMSRDEKETALEKEQRLNQEVLEGEAEIARQIQEGAASQEEIAKLTSKTIAAKRELLQLEQQQKSEADAKLKREQEVAKEIERINGMAAEEDKRSKQTKEDLQRIAEEAQKKLEQGVESQEEQNKLLREMEDAKRRIMDMDKKAADDRKRIAEEEKRNAEEAKKRLLEGPQGDGIRAAASSREAVIDRIARETNRKRGTVGQMIDSGKISPTEINKAIEANINDMVGSTVKQTGQVMGDVGNSLEQVGKVLGGHDVEMAQFRERVRRFEEFIKSYEENGRRRRARDNSA